MRVLRGAGPAGLAALPASRGRFLRPLLSLSRADVRCYLAEKNIRWREDSTNADVRFLRNRVRRRLVPLLDESFPGWRRGLAALAGTQALAADFIAREARRRIGWTAAPDGGSLVLCAGAGIFFAQPEIIREEALFQGINLLLRNSRAAEAGVSVKRNSLRRFCESSAGAADLGPVRARLSGGRQEGRLMLQAANKPPSETGFALLIKEPGLYTLNKIRVEVRLCGVSEDGAAPDRVFFARLPLALRPAFNDDFIVKAGKKTTPRNLAKSTRLWSAVDPLGTAAFFGPEGLLLCRDFPGEAQVAAALTFAALRGKDVQ
jgi:tRNA(Ile)-lysidine synthase